tara:strand:- start:104 stop:301 length:198 start_codon:yes stop_codon:yes gene_type:complete
MDTINAIDKYDEYEIMKMIDVYEKYLKQKEYRRNYYKNKYKNDELFRNKKKEENKIYMRNKRANM